MTALPLAALPLTALGRVEGESGRHAFHAARAGGWALEGVDLLSLGSLEMTLATASRLRDLGVVVRLGHAGQPDPQLETAILAAPGALMAIDSVRVEADWRWVARSTSPRQTVVVDTVALAECGHLLAERGVIPRVVPPGATLKSRIELAADGSSLIVEASDMPPAWVELAGSALLREIPSLWFGLIRNLGRRPPAQGQCTVWLAFGPRIDETGTLKSLLRDFAEFGIDLSHLRSAAGINGRHVFHSAFVVEKTTTLDRLLERLSNKKVQHRVLAVLPGAHTTHAAAQVAPEWTPYE